MKINGNKISQLIKIYTSKQEENQRLASVGTRRNEYVSQRLEISNQATEILRIRAIIEEQAANSNPTRESYLKQIETQLENGEYKINGRNIALKMMQDTITGLIL